MFQRASSWISYPDQYRITGFEIYVNQDIIYIHRRAYDFLAWIGDIGGFLQGIGWVGYVLVGFYYSPKNGHSFLVSKLFRKASENFKRKKLLQMVKMVIV